MEKFSVSKKYFSHNNSSFNHVKYKVFHKLLACSFTLLILGTRPVVYLEMFPVLALGGEGGRTETAQELDHLAK